MATLLGHNRTLGYELMMVKPSRFLLHGPTKERRQDRIAALRRVHDGWYNTDRLDHIRLVAEFGELLGVSDELEQWREDQGLEPGGDDRDSGFWDCPF